MPDIDMRVRERIEDELKDARRAKVLAERRLDRMTQRHTKSDAQYREAVEAIGDSKVTEERVARLLRNLTRQTVLKVRATNEVMRLDAVIARLEDPREFDRRAALARRLGQRAARAGVEDPSGRAAVEVVLLHAGRPMHYTEITRVALESGLIRTKGKTPKQTISAYLTRAVKEGDTFVKVEPGVFGLADRDVVEA